MAILMVAAALWGALLAGRDSGGGEARPQEGAIATGGNTPGVRAIAAGDDTVWTLDAATRLVRGYAADDLRPSGPSRRLGAQGDVPAAMARSGRSLWIGLRRSGTGLVVLLGPSLAVERVLPTGGVLPRRLAVLPGRVVVLGDDRVAGIGLRGRPTWSAPLPSGVDVAAGYGAVWTLSATAGGGGTVARRDPGTGRVVERMATSAAGRAIAVGFGAIWVANGCDNGVLRLPVRGGGSVCTRVGKGPDDVTVGRGAAWAADGPGRRVVELDAATGRVVGSWAAPGRPSSVIAGPGGLFALTRAGRTARPATDGAAAERDEEPVVRP